MPAGPPVIASPATRASPHEVHGGNDEQREERERIAIARLPAGTGLAASWRADARRRNQQLRQSAERLGAQPHCGLFEQEESPMLQRQPIARRRDGRA